MNTINIKALAALANELNMHADILEDKLKQSGITIQCNESTGFRRSRQQRRHMLELY